MRNYITTLTILFLLLSQTLFPSALADSKQEGLTTPSNTSQEALKLAVVVGINKYSGISGVSPLNYAATDALSLQESLEKQGYIVFALYDEKATRNFIKKAISKISQLATNEEDKKNATLIFSFSGHGFAVDDQNYLVTYDTDRENVIETGLALSSVIDSLKATGIPQKVIFVDACRNNPGQKSSAGSFIDQQADGLGILFSTRSGDVSYESSSINSGIFSHFLVKGLDGAAASKNGIVSLHSLKRYVERRVPEWTVKNLQVVQTPYQAGEYTGEFRLAYAAPLQQSKTIIVTEAEPVQQLAPQLIPSPVNNATNNSEQLAIYIQANDSLSEPFRDTLANYLKTNHPIKLATSAENAKLVINVSAANLELVQAGQKFNIRGDLLLTGSSDESSDNEVSEFITVNGSSFKDETEAVQKAADKWVKNISLSATVGIVKKALKK